MLKKALADKDKFKVATYHSDMLEGDIEIHKIPVDKVFELIDIEDDSMIGQYKANCELIYECVPAFHDSELIAAYECVEPYDVVSKVFNDNMAEITKLIQIILGLYGLNNSVDDLKN